MHGLNLYDYSARYYESAVGGFTSVDPHAENYYNWSPYAYVGNNPFDNGDWSDNIGDHLFYNMSRADIMIALSRVKLSPYILKANRTVNKTIAYYMAALESYKGADFTFSFLAQFYKKYTGKDPLKGPTGFREASYVENATYFRIKGDNTIYNIYDAGNFIWGAWMKSVGFSSLEIIGGSNYNETIRGNGIDSNADQKAILRGIKWFNKK